MTVTAPAPPSGPAIVKLGGGLDLAAAPGLREQLTDMLHRGADPLILDLSQVMSCDTAGLGVLIATQRRARLLGSTMCLHAPSIAVTRVLRLTGLDRTFSISAA
jgi:anti-sigma B factor antagonist